MGARRGHLLNVRTRVAGALVASAAWWAIATTALAASPTPSAAVGGDPRSAGQGPGLVGDPAFAVLAVIAIGLGAVVVTLAYLRMTSRGGG